MYIYIFYSIPDLFLEPQSLEEIVSWSLMHYSLWHLTLTALDNFSQLLYKSTGTWTPPLILLPTDGDVVSLPTTKA